MTSLEEPYQSLHSVYSCSALQLSLRRKHFTPRSPRLFVSAIGVSAVRRCHDSTTATRETSCCDREGRYESGSLPNQQHLFRESLRSSESVSGTASLALLMEISMTKSVQSILIQMVLTSLEGDPQQDFLPKYFETSQIVPRCISW